MIDPYITIYSYRWPGHGMVMSRLMYGSLIRSPDKRALCASRTARRATSKNVRSGPISGRNLLEVAAVGTPGVWPYMPEDIARLLPTGERYELIVKSRLDNFSVAIA